MRLTPLLTLVLLGLAPVQALAQQDQLLNSQSQSMWKAEDKCAADSITAYPDHDLASLRNRDTFVDKCLAKHHLPPRQHQAPGN